MKRILFEDKVGNRTISLSTPVYEAVREFIMRVLMEKGEITFIELLNLAEQDSSLRLEAVRKLAIKILIRLLFIGEL